MLASSGGPISAESVVDALPDVIRGLLGDRRGRVAVTDDDWVERRTGVRPTPPPLTWVSEGPSWDESLRPTGAEPPDDVVFEPRGLAVGMHLIEVHDHFRAELERVYDILDQVRRGALEVGAARSQVNAMALRSNNWALGSFCQSYCRAITEHHSMESEVVFGHLRISDDRLADVVDRLHEEHEAIHELLDALDAELVALVARPDQFDGIERALARLSDALLSHFSYEERELIPPLARFGFYPGQV